MNNITENFRTIQIIFLIAVFLLGCQTSNNTVEIVPSVVPTVPANQKEIWELWESSKHSNTYDLEKGPNTYCAKCHSPTNWDYAAKIDDPPNCVSCKFPHESTPRIAENNQLIPENEWADIGCEVCHRTEGKLAEAGIGWYDNATGYYETVENSTELCEKCHTNSENFLMHKREIGDLAHKDLNCTDCHNPHDTYARCSNEACHSDVTSMRLMPTESHLNLTEISECLACHPKGMDTHSMEIQREGNKDCRECHDYLVNVSKEDLAPVQHSKIHLRVNCVACHDAAGLEVQYVENDNKWMTFRTTTTPFGESTAPYQSHNLQLEVECARCHFENNPWDLKIQIIMD